MLVFPPESSYPSLLLRSALLQLILTDYPVLTVFQIRVSEVQKGDTNQESREHMRTQQRGFRSLILHCLFI